jgi:glycosyltransferase involved in cell wall biosynthesis
MKQLIIVSYLDYPYPSGLAKRMNGLLKILVSEGIKVKIIAPIGRGNGIFPTIEKFDNFSIERVDLRKIAIGDSNRYSIKLLQWLIFSIIACFKLTKIKVKNVNAIIQYQSIYSAIPALFARFFFRSKIIGDDIILIHPIIDIPVLKLTQIIVTPSQRTLDFVENFEKRTLYIPNGIEGINPKQKIYSENSIFFIGALIFNQNLKAIENIIQIASNLDKDGLLFEVFIVGNPLKLIKHLFRHPLVKKGKIKFLGNLSNKELKKIKERSFIGLLPFFEDTPLIGGQRTKAMEYFSDQLLVISGPEGVRGILGLKPGKHFLLVKTPLEMSEIIKDCFLKPKKYLNIASSGAKFVSKNYSWKIISKEYINLLKNLYSKYQNKVKSKEK